MIIHATLARILEQAEKALAEEPVECLKDVNLGLYGLSHQTVRIGTIIAIVRTALEEEDVHTEVRSSW